MNAARVIIIGASSGIGRALAIEYVKKGCRVAITGRRKDLLEEIRSLYPDHIIATSFDVTGTENKVYFDKMTEELGGLDLFIYNAGYGSASSELHWQEENITTKTNVAGFVEMMHLSFQYFRRKGKGQIAIISSVAALRGNSWSPAYSASKAYMSNYAEGLQMKADRFKQNISITDIRPGFVDTKISGGHGRFWMAPVDKAARQIIRAIRKKKRVAYITRRWWLVACLMRLLPYFIYRRIA